MKSLFLILILTASTSYLSAQTVSVSIPSNEISSTQAIILTTASGSGAPYTCTYRACQGAGCSLSANNVPDVNTTLFAGSNSESRTVKGVTTAGFSGVNHWFALGSRTYDLSSSTTLPWQSRALQAATTYTVGVTCGTASEVTATFTTQTVPLGESWQELPPLDSRAWNNLPVPTPNYAPGSGQDWSTTDAMTGVEIKRITGPLNKLVSQQTQAVFSYAEDLSGGGWSNVNNAYTNQAASTLASTSTTNAKLFVSYSQIDPNMAAQWANSYSLVDFNVIPFGYAPSGTTMQTCFTANTTTCNSATLPFSLPVGTTSASAAAATPVNSTYPTPILSKWQPFTTPQGQTTISNVPAQSTSGATICNATGGASNILGCSPSPALASYSNSLILLTVDACNTGTPTLNISGLGPVYINIAGGRVTTANQLCSSTNYTLTFDSVQFNAQGLLVSTGGSSNKTLTWGSGSINFSGDWPVGSRVRINGSCLAHIAAPGASQLTMQIDTNCGSLTNATFELFNAGILVWMSAGTSANVSFTFDELTGSNMPGNSNAEYDIASLQPITDINTDRYGNPISPSETGYLMSIVPTATALGLFIPATGEYRFLSSLFNNNQGTSYYGYMSPFISGGAFDQANNKKFYLGGSNQHMYSATLNASGTYPELIPTSYPPIGDALTYADISATTTSIASQLATLAGSNPSAFGAANTAYLTGLFSTFAPDGSINGNLYWRSSTGGDTHPIIVAVADHSNNLLQAYTSFDHFPTRWGGQHFSRLAVLNNAYIATNDMENFDGNLGGPWPMDATLGLWKDGTGAAGTGTLSTSTFAVTTATNASNPTFTVAGIALDPYFNQNFGTCNVPSTTCGPRLKIAGGTGNWAAANGTFIANVPPIPDGGNHPTNVNTFTIPALNSTSWGSVTGSLTVTVAPALINSSISNVTNATPPVVTVNTTVGVRTIGHDLQDGDSIEFYGCPGCVGTQYFAHVSGSNTTFSVYTSLPTGWPGSTNWTTATPLAGNSALSSAGQVHFVEQCPTGLPASVTTGLYLDTGATGLRCIAIRVLSQPCDRWAGSAEQTAYPPATGCPAGSATLQNIAVGDSIADIGRNAGDEKMIVVQVNPASGGPSGALDIVFMRFYGNKFPNFNGNINNSSGGSHDTGWTPRMVVSDSNSTGAFAGYVPIGDPTNTAVPVSTLTTCHTDIGYGWPQGNYSYSGCGNGPYDGIANVAFGSPTTPGTLVYDLLAPTNTHQNCPLFAGNSASSLGCSNGESYATDRTYFKQVPYSMNWHAMNPAEGSGVAEGAVIYSGVTTPSLVGGTSNTFLMSLANNNGTVIDIKRSPIITWAAGRVFITKAGPGVSLLDSDKDRQCPVYIAGDCVSGSTPGQVYASFTNTVLVKGNGSPIDLCQTNTYDVATACSSPISYYAGWATQEQIVPVDTTATMQRRLSMGFAAPFLHFTYQTQYTEPTGQWNMFASTFSNGWRSDFFGINLPPWPTNQINIAALQSFIPIPISIPAHAGANQATIQFGYSEYGGPFYCTQMRQENCVTDIPTQSGHTSDPYSFVTSDTHTATSCASGCSISIPALSSHVVNYQIQYFNNGTFVANGAAGITMAAPQFTALSNNTRGIQRCLICRVSFQE